MKTASIKSYAKINLGLNVLGKDEAGYHLLDMIMLPIELHDSILINQLIKAQDNFVTIDDFSQGLIRSNLATFAIENMAESFKFNNKFRVFIHKNIPMNAGLGGGSSNAASTMLGVQKLLKINQEGANEELFNIATRLGCDVPFFLYNKPMRCQGRGEKLTPIEIKNNYYVLLVKPDGGCHTSEIYKKYDELPGENCDIDKIILALKEGDDATIAKEVKNSLERASISMLPEIQDIKSELYNLGFDIVLMSGSGSTCFAMSTDKNLVKTAAKTFENRYLVEITKVLK